MKPGAGEWRSRFFLAILSAILTMGAMEVAARFWLRPPPPRVVDGTPISELSSTLGWRTRALGAQRIRREDFEVSVALNRLGLRGPEIPYQAAPGVRRLAIMGDSFAHGYYAEEPETVRGRLASALRSCQVDVLNAGAPGYSTDQEWLYFGEEISKYQPSEVVLLFYYNDLLFNTERIGTGNRSKPVLVEASGALEVLPPDLSASRGIAREDRLSRRRNAPTFRGSALWAFAAGRLRSGRPDWSRRLAAYGLAPESSREPPFEFLPFGAMGARERELVDLMWKRTAEILLRFRDDVRGQGAGFSVFYVPSRFEVNEDGWTFMKRRYEANRPWDRDVVSARLTRLLATLDIPLLDASTAFRGAEATAQRAYLPVDGHWNARGNEIAFQALLPPMRRALSCGS